MATTSPSSTGILNNAYQISQTAGRPVAYSDKYNHMCARGASAVAASMTNNPAVFDKVAANAWDSRSKYQDTGLYNQNKDYPPGGVTSSDLANVPPGTVVTFQYGAYGHAMTFMGNDPTTGQPQWASDNVNDSPDKFLKKGNLEGISIITPNEKGQAAISQQCGNLATGQQAAYSPPPGGVAGTGGVSGDGTASSGSTFSTGVADQPLTPDEAVTLNSQFFNDLGPGAMAPVEPLEALQGKAQNPYSNRQVVTPISITYHVEGIDIDADLMTKIVTTNSYNPAKQNSILGIKRTTDVNVPTESPIHDADPQLKLTDGQVPLPNGAPVVSF
jgi:hypothetical protein